jgi:hypothetical protein
MCHPPVDSELAPPDVSALSQRSRTQPAQPPHTFVIKQTAKVLKVEADQLYFAAGLLDDIPRRGVSDEQVLTAFRALTRELTKKA